MARREHIYANRRMSEFYPGLREKAFETFVDATDRRADHKPTLRKMLTYLNRLVDIDRCKNVLVIGCGPKPQTLEFFLEEGFNAHGVEPVVDYVRTAGEYLGDSTRVLTGVAEQIPVPDESQDIVVCESVLEHVESPIYSLEEIYRVLSPGGIAYVGTTNRLRFSFSGNNGE